MVLKIGTDQPVQFVGPRIEDLQSLVQHQKTGDDQTAEELENRGLSPPLTHLSQITNPSLYFSCFPFSNPVNQSSTPSWSQRRRRSTTTVSSLPSLFQRRCRSTTNPPPLSGPSIANYSLQYVVSLVIRCLLVIGVLGTHHKTSHRALMAAAAASSGFVSSPPLPVSPPSFA
ncbi:hypothetical protein PIB30_044495 [Stylosanthes scabra]|uniref:Uncharacterized protein n=1 Tax=Stylosanthes scabra TaxID=79078 RepID=A0ABU6XGS9_9FABA|nr:hypothetical protein [Stylosanthes scabra]